MRDIAVTLAVFSMLPFVLRQPWVGILVFNWLSLMNPHRLAYGFSLNFPFAMIVAATTIGAYMYSKEKKEMVWTRDSRLLLAFILWMCLTTAFAMYPTLAVDQLNKVLKIQLMVFVGLMLMRSFDRIEALLWVAAMSIGFYGLKGGIFTITRGGVYRVNGPDNTFISGNNEIGLALAMTVPLLYFMRGRISSYWLKMGMTVWVVLAAFAAIGTQSRGALLGMVAMATFIWLNSRSKFLTALILVGTAVPIAMFMPDSWYERMGTIKTHDQDESAQGRVNAWWTAYNVASNRLLGGGFECFQAPTFAIYAPNPDNVHDVHSVVFEVMGEHGFIGLGLFALLAFLSWMTAGKTARLCRKMPDMIWVAEMMRMVQVSLVAYWTAGLFLGLAYFDYYYTLLAIIFATSHLVKKRVAAGNDAAKIADLRPEGFLVNGDLPWPAWLKRKRPT